ncbi:hypothetical protein CEUSTIGMA_g10356.t1 [Chlamydomonas eustigma]|uniref:Guanylate cyclase domain-containing protein n=1 Tax=Chlamydomonas eustigma TaxID=1157962 RepID=A0A250XJ35_9CHLO|nr:hypothetical protein CEUSTIGMA_g10356.t1 [Chlamydomonas eustigma]|eukprot:GAX82929.1 hypothetical protein CEUSTIGMA_g10356.t1 [Chlamydomonas eustigma]
MPRLPKGLAFSKVLSPVVNPPYAQGTYQTILEDTVLTSYWNLGNASYHGLNYPNILIENFPDSPAFYLNWMLDPEYYLYEGCQCTQGTMMVTHEYHGLTVPQCVEISRNSLSWWNQMPWIFIIVALVAAAVLVGLAWYFLLRRASRPQILQDLIDMRRRIKGPSTAGTVSFVVTDIESFTGLMKEYPDLAMSALIIHNNLIQKVSVQTSYLRACLKGTGLFSLRDDFSLPKTEKLVLSSTQIQHSLLNEAGVIFYTNPILTSK